MADCGCKIGWRSITAMQSVPIIEHCLRHSEANVEALEKDYIELKDAYDRSRNAQAEAQERNRGLEEDLRIVREDHSVCQKHNGMAVLEIERLTEQLAQLRGEYDEEVKSHDIEEADLKAKLQARERECRFFMDVLLTVSEECRRHIPDTEAMANITRRVERLMSDVKAERKEKG